MNRFDRVARLLCGVAAIVAFSGLWAHEYGYYSFMRWTIMSAALVSGVIALIAGRGVSPWVFLGITILFNPIWPVVLIRPVWRVLDVIVGVTMLAAVFSNANNRDGNP